MNSQRYHVVRYTAAGRLVAIIAGLGRNNRTWDAERAVSWVMRQRAPFTVSNIKGYAYEVTRTGE